MKHLDWKSFAIGGLFTSTLLLSLGAKQLQEQVNELYPKEHLAFRTKTNNEFSEKEFSEKLMIWETLAGNYAMPKAFKRTGIQLKEFTFLNDQKTKPTLSYT